MLKLNFLGLESKLLHWILKQFNMEYYDQHKKLLEFDIFRAPVCPEVTCQPNSLHVTNRTT